MIPLMEEIQKEPDFKLNYNFSSEEIAALAKFLRKNIDSLPEGLENFQRALEDSVYNCLSIDEVRKFYT